MPTPSSPKIAAGPRAELTDRIERAAKWFTVIAVLAVVHAAVLAFTGNGITAAIGLGVSTLLPKIASPFGLFALNLLPAAGIAAFGVLAARRYTWAFISGMACYAVDALLLWKTAGIGVVIHVVLLILIADGLRAIADWQAIEKMIVNDREADPMSPNTRTSIDL